MVLKLAWRNIWRNRRRSVIIILSMVVGYTALIMMDSLMTGMIHQMLKNEIGTYTAHIEIHRRGYLDNSIIQNFMPSDADVEKVIDKTPGIKGHCRRVLTFGMASSASGSSGVTIVGAKPAREKEVTTIEDYIEKGSYLSNSPREVMLSRELAEKLDVGIGERVVLMASGLDGTIGSELFRVVGIFKTPSLQFDRSHVYIPISSARKLLSMEGGAMEFALTVKDISKLDTIKADLASALGPSFEVSTYRDLQPILIAQFDLFEKTMLIFYAVIGIAIMFGVINTMLMAVYERIHEFGILSSIGMNSRSVYSMIITEGLLLGLIGTVIGVSSGIAVSMLFSRSGIDLSFFEESLTYFGSGAVIHPVLTLKGILLASSIVPVTSVIGTLYPGYKAAKLEPVEALRYV